MATLSDHLATLTAKLQAADPITVRFRRGSESAVIVGSNGKDLRWPYNGAADPPVGKRFWLQRPISLGSSTIKPREGDLLEGILPAAITGRVYELVAFGAEPPCGPANADSCWRCNCLDTTDAPRRDTVVDIEIPDPDAERAPSGNKDRTAYLTDVQDLNVTLTAESGQELQVGGKLQQVRTFRVTMAARLLRKSSRLRIKSGWLEEQRIAEEKAGLVVPEAMYLSIETVSRDSAYSLETTAHCRLVGG